MTVTWRGCSRNWEEDNFNSNSSINMSGIVIENESQMKSNEEKVTPNTIKTFSAFLTDKQY